MFAATFGALTSFYVLLSVLPRYAVTVGAGTVGAGVTTGALMLTTTVTELATPWLVSRLGQRTTFAAGLVLLGLPALALPAASSLGAIAAVCLVRGVGFAILVVMGSALVAVLAPPERLGEGLGLYGVVAGVPWVAALPLGLWLGAHAGYTVVFLIGAVSALAGLAALPGVPRGRPTPPAVGVLGTLRMPAQRRPAVVFMTTAIAAGALMTFLPLVLPDGSGNGAAVALLVFAAASTLGRWWTGRHTDRHPSRELLAPAVLATAVGTAMLALPGGFGVVIGAMVVAGAGFGIAQNASLTTMFARAGGASHDMVSAVWNLAYDTGLGAGGFGFGLVAARAGYPASFAITAGVMLAAVAFAWVRSGQVTGSA
ncbi:MAG: MFS transporter [Candidatus Palauibacterales bacterium]|nr:MFS transporter [Candidatus Palauibacterales bacterium]MDP2528417.1 MFS transporter [Candidatus Palauibacterales bacterium]MDP2585003.1 MFS transporter [Candidatus Palauibacterales bacterium]